jgi:hypothetical protein
VESLKTAFGEWALSPGWSHLAEAYAGINGFDSLKSTIIESDIYY